MVMRRARSAREIGWCSRIRLSAMCRLMSREVVRVATWKSRVLILRISDPPVSGYCLKCEQYAWRLVLSRHFSCDQKSFFEGKCVRAKEKFVLPVTPKQSHSDNT